MQQKFPLFPLRIPYKGKNKGKYISFHYIMGWKACKIRKVQEISLQIPIYKFLVYIFYHIVFPKHRFLNPFHLCYYTFFPLTLFTTPDTLKFDGSPDNLCVRIHTYQVAPSAHRIYKWDSGSAIHLYLYRLISCY